MAAAPAELTRREREAIEAQRKKDHYMKLHAEGKTDEAKVMLGRCTYAEFYVINELHMIVPKVDLSVAHSRLRHWARMRHLRFTASVRSGSGYLHSYRVVSIWTYCSRIITNSMAQSSQEREAVVSTTT